MWWYNIVSISWFFKDCVPCFKLRHSSTLAPLKKCLSCKLSVLYTAMMRSCTKGRIQTQMGKKTNRVHYTKQRPVSPFVISVIKKNQSKDSSIYGKEACDHAQSVLCLTLRYQDNNIRKFIFTWINEKTLQIMTLT